MRNAGRLPGAVSRRGGTDRYRDGSGWQDSAGYSRAVRRGDLIAVSGTTADGADGRASSPGDTAAQVRQALDAVLTAVTALLGEGFLVEIEADAVVVAPAPTGPAAATPAGAAP